MATINLGAALWALAKAKLSLKVAASASLNSHGRILIDGADDLLTKDVWIHKGHNFHFSFHVSFDSLSSASGALNANTLADFITSALAQPPFWSQLHLVPTFSVPNSAIETCRANIRRLDLILGQDNGSGFNLSNTNLPNGISPVSLMSVQVHLTFSQIFLPLKRTHKRTGEGSPSFEDLLSAQHNRQIPHLDLKSPDWQDDECETLGDFEIILDRPPCLPVTLLRGIDDPLKSPKEMCSSVFSGQNLNTAYRANKDTVLLHEKSSFQTNESGRTPTSGSLSTLEFLEPNTTGCFRSAGERTVNSPSPSTICKPHPPPEHDQASFQSILSLTDAALRTLINVQPTRLSAGIKLCGTDSGLDPDSSPDKQRTTALSDLAPSLFAPGYAQAVVERAPLVPSIAKSLATFLKYGRGSGSDEACDGEPQGRSDDEERPVQDGVKDALRRDVWMTMTNGLRVSYFEKARRLKPLTMPRWWREHDREDDVLMTVEEGEVEMLDEAFISHAPSLGRGGEWPEEEILEVVEGEIDCGIEHEDEDEDEDDLLLDSEEVDLSFLEDEFEELGFFGRDVEMDDFANHAEEMLL